MSEIVLSNEGSDLKVALTARWQVQVFVIACAMSSGCVTADEIRELQRGFVDNRMAIERWHFAISFDNEVFDPSTSESSDALLELVTCVDGEHQRTEHRYRYKPEERFPGLTEDDYRQFEIWDRNSQTYWKTQRFPRGKVAISIYSRDSVDPPRQLGTLLYDARWLGWCPQFDYEPAKLISNPNFVDWNVTDDVVGGIACKRLVYRRKTGSDEGTIWMAPQLGHSVLRREFRYSTEEESGLNVGTFEVAQWKDSGIWFPTRAVREKFDADGNLLRRQTMTIDILSINEPLDPELFSLKSLGAPPQTSVSPMPRPNPDPVVKYKWDGEKVVELVPETGAKELPTAADDGSSFRRWSLLANALIFMGIGVYLLRCRYFGPPAGDDSTPHLEDPRS